MFKSFESGSLRNKVKPVPGRIVIDSCHGNVPAVKDIYFEDVYTDPVEKVLSLQAHEDLIFTALARNTNIAAVLPV